MYFVDKFFTHLFEIKHSTNRFFCFQPQFFVENDLVVFIAQAIVYLPERHQFHVPAIVAGTG